VGGRTGGSAFSNAVEEYDPALNGWSPQMSSSSLHHSFGYASIGPSFYLIGGTVPGGTVASFESVGCLEYFAHTIVYPFVKN
jgi:hypothetical protein